MKRTLSSLACALAALIFVGCSTPLPPGAERGPHNTMAYLVRVDASPPGARIEVNGEDVGPGPVQVKIFGDPDGTFHDFGSDYYIIRALPVTTNQFAQTRTFHTGRMFGPEDRIPDRIYFDMNQPQQAPPVPYGPSMYYAPPPMFYHSPYYYGPRFYFHHGHGFRHRRW